MTIYDVKRIHEEKDPDYFFNRDTMRFFGQTLRSFSVARMAGEPERYRIAANMKHGGKLVGVTVRIFDPATGKLEDENEGATK